MTLLAIDPGRGKGKTIGFALFDSRGEEFMRDVTDWNGLVRRFRRAFGNTVWFDMFQIHNVVCENFVNDPRVARGGQTNGTSEVIGAIEFTCAQAGIPFYRQDRSELPAAKRHAQYTDTHKHLPHQDAAYLHGYHWLVGRGVLKAKGIEATLA